MSGSTENLKRRQEQANKAYAAMIAILFFSYCRGVGIFPSEERIIVKLIGNELMRYGGKIRDMEVFGAKYWTMDFFARPEYLASSLVRLVNSGVLLERFGHYVVVPARLQAECLGFCRGIDIPVDVLEDIAIKFNESVDCYYLAHLVNGAPTGALSFFKDN